MIWSVGLRPNAVKVIFSHGHLSSPQSRKIQVLAPRAQALGFETEAIDYRDLRDDPFARVDRLCSRIEALDQPPVLVGSSLGGLVSMAAAERLDVAGLFLMAPALFMEDRVPNLSVRESLCPQDPPCPGRTWLARRDHRLREKSALRRCVQCTPASATGRSWPGRCHRSDRLVAGRLSGRCFKVNRDASLTLSWCSLRRSFARPLTNEHHQHPQPCRVLRFRERGPGRARCPLRGLRYPEGARKAVAQGQYRRAQGLLRLGSLPRVQGCHA
jgi:pimeloyl-ACP methyl ester carboxylesterase